MSLTCSTYGGWAWVRRSHSVRVALFASDSICRCLVGDGRARCGHVNGSQTQVSPSVLSGAKACAERAQARIAWKYRARCGVASTCMVCLFSPLQRCFLLTLQGMHDASTLTATACCEVGGTQLTRACQQAHHVGRGAEGGGRTAHREIWREGGNGGRWRRRPVDVVWKWEARDIIAKNCVTIVNCGRLWTTLPSAGSCGEQSGKPLLRQDGPRLTVANTSPNVCSVVKGRE